MNRDQIEAEAITVDKAVKAAAQGGCVVGLNGLQPVLLAGPRQAWSTLFVLGSICIAELRKANPGSPDRELVLRTDAWTTGGSAKIPLNIETPRARQAAAELVGNLLRSDLLATHLTYLKAVLTAPCRDCFTLQVSHVLLHAALTLADSDTDACGS